MAKFKNITNLNKKRFEDTSKEVKITQSNPSNLGNLGNLKKVTSKIILKQKKIIFEEKRADKLTSKIQLKKIQLKTLLEDDSIITQSKYMEFLFELGEKLNAMDIYSPPNEKGEYNISKEDLQKLKIVN